MRGTWEVPIPEGDSVWRIVKADPKPQAKFGPTILCRFEMEHEGSGSAHLELFLSPNLGSPEKLSLLGQLLVAGGRDPRKWGDDHPFMNNVSLAVIDMVSEGAPFIGKVKLVSDPKNPDAPPRARFAGFRPLPAAPATEPSPRATSAARPRPTQARKPEPPPEEVVEAGGDPFAEDELWDPEGS